MTTSAKNAQRHRLNYCLDPQSASSVVDLLLANFSKRARTPNDPLGKLLPDPDSLDLTRRSATHAEKVELVASLIWNRVYPVMMRANRRLHKPQTSSGLLKLLSSQSVKAMTLEDFKEILHWLEPLALEALRWQGPLRSELEDPNRSLAREVNDCQLSIGRCDLHRAAASVDRLQRLLESRRKIDIDAASRIQALIQISDFYVYLGDTQKELFYATEAVKLSVEHPELLPALHVDAATRHLFAIFHRNGGPEFFHYFESLNADFELHVSKPEAAAWEALARHTLEERPERALDVVVPFLNELQIANFITWLRVDSALCNRDVSSLVEALKDRASILNLRGPDTLLCAHKLTLHIASTWLRSLGMNQIYSFTHEYRTAAALQAIA